MHKMVRLISAVALLALVTTSANAAGKTTIDPNTIQTTKAPAAELAGASDKRLDRKIEYDAGDARLHRVIADLAKMSDVTIHCGANNDDWQVRDIPVTVAARGVTLRKLLYALTLSTHTTLKAAKTEKGIIVYRLYRDAAIQKTIDDYFATREEHDRQMLKWTWDAATKLKDIPPSQIKNPGWEAEAWQDELKIQMATSGLISVIDADTRAKILSGEAMQFTPRTAPSPLRERLMALLQAQDDKRVRVTTQLVKTLEDQGYIPSNDLNTVPATTTELADSVVYMRLPSNDDISLFLNIKTDPAGKNNHGQAVPYTTVRACAGTIERSDIDLPSQPGYTIPKIESFDKSFQPDHTMNWPGLPEKVKIEFPKDGKPKWCADAIIALSKATGITIVTEDFQTHLHETEQNSLAGKEMTFQEALQRAYWADPWWSDKEAKVFAGTSGLWQDRHRILIPESLIDKLVEKAAKNGVEIDDITPLVRYPTGSAYEWIFRTKCLEQLDTRSLTYPEDKSFWILYDCLSAEDKALAKSSAGLPLGTLDPRVIKPILQEIAKQSQAKLNTTESENARIAHLTDAAVLPTLTMRVISWVPGGWLTPDMPNWQRRHSWKVSIEGTYAGEKLTTETTTLCRLPYYSPEREKELAAGDK